MFTYADKALADGKIILTQNLFWKAFVSVSFTLWTRWDFISIVDGF